MQALVYCNAHSIHPSIHPSFLPSFRRAKFLRRVGERQLQPRAWMSSVRIACPALHPNQSSYSPLSIILPLFPSRVLSFLLVNRPVASSLLPPHRARAALPNHA